jgi:hypothetical protein
VKELNNVTFEFDNAAVGQTVMRTMKGQLQHILVVRFGEGGKCVVGRELLAPV